MLILFQNHNFDKSFGIDVKAMEILENAGTYIFHILQFHSF
jgi:hypothetical protein